jgi:putative ABC transport system permease protein
MQLDADAEMLYEKEQGDVITQLDMLESYSMELDAEYIITIYLASTGVLLISSLLPMLYIIRMKPKNIMLN